MKVMLDTHICIYVIRQKPEAVLARFRAFEAILGYRRSHSPNYSMAR